MKKIAVLMVVGVSLAGCVHYDPLVTHDEKVVHGAIIGGVAGGVIGGIATASAGGALIGAGIGAVAGAHIASSY